MKKVLPQDVTLKLVCVFHAALIHGLYTYNFLLHALGKTYGHCYLASHRYGRLGIRSVGGTVFLNYPVGLSCFT